MFTLLCTAAAIVFIGAFLSPVFLVCWEYASMRRRRRGSVKVYYKLAAVSVLCILLAMLYYLEVLPELLLFIFGVAFLLASFVTLVGMLLSDLFPKRRANRLGGNDADQTAGAQFHVPRILRQFGLKTLFVATFVCGVIFASMYYLGPVGLLLSCGTVVFLATTGALLWVMFDDSFRPNCTGQQFRKHKDDNLAAGSLPTDEVAADADAVSEKHKKRWWKKPVPRWNVGHYGLWK